MSRVHVEDSPQRAVSSRLVNADVVDSEVLFVEVFLHLGEMAEDERLENGIGTAHERDKDSAASDTSGVETETMDVRNSVAGEDDTETTQLRVRDDNTDWSYVI